MARAKKGPARKAKAKKSSGRATSAKVVARSAKKPVKKLAKARKAPAPPRQLDVGATQPYLGQIASFPFTFAPSGWAACTGQVLPISRYVMLFSLIRTTYGGNGTSDFMLPNLPARSPSGPWYYIAIDGIFPPQN